MFVKRVGLFRRQTPEPRAKILAPGAFKIIAVRDFSSDLMDASGDRPA